MPKVSKPRIKARLKPLKAKKTLQVKGQGKNAANSSAGSTTKEKPAVLLTSGYYLGFVYTNYCPSAVSAACRGLPSARQAYQQR
jgi:hypothetical protein